MTRPPAAPTLALRPLASGDCDRLLAWIDSEDAMYQWSGARSFSWPLDRGQLLRDLAAHDRSGGLYAAAATTTAGAREMVGHVRLDAEHHHGLGFIGRVVIAPDQRGRGLGTALMRETVRHAFDDLGLHRLQLTVYTFNTAAIACYRSVGFVVEGVSRDSTRGSDGRWTLLTMSLLEPDQRRPITYGGGVRAAGPRDAERIAALLTQRGSPHDRAQASQRLQEWAANPDGIVLVDDVNGAVAGVIAVHRVPYFDAPAAHARIVALSVDAGHRQAGTERRLLDAAERWGAARGCGQLEVAPPVHMSSIIRPVG